jgi:hypothetical protein
LSLHVFGVPVTPPELVAASVEEFFEILNGDAARLKMFE